MAKYGGTKHIIPLLWKHITSSDIKGVEKSCSRVLYVIFFKMHLSTEICLHVAFIKMLLDLLSKTPV